MRKTVFVLLFLFIAGAAVTAQEISSIAVMPEPFDDGEDSKCEIRQSFVDVIIEQVLPEMGLTGYGYREVTQSSCYERGDYNNIYVNVNLKKSAEDYVTKRLSISFHTSTDYDYSVLFTELEDEVIGYTLKRKYVEYLEKGTDEEYYIRINPKYSEGKTNCDSLRDYYNGLTGEKYFNDEYGYCSAVLKTRTSQIKSLVSKNIGGVYYFSDKLRFNFAGYSEGSFDLESIASSGACDLSRQDYYYPELVSKCYGIYKDKTRIHFSASHRRDNWNAYLSVYGYLNGQGIISVNAYGKNINEQEVLDFVKEKTLEYLGTAYSLTLSRSGAETITSLRDESFEYSSLSGRAEITGLEIKASALEGLELRDYVTSKEYWSENVSISISEPYVQVYVPEELGEATVEKALVGIPHPYYWGRSFTITSSRVYSNINLEENNPALAEQRIKEFVDPFIQTGSWNLSMTVTGSYYPRPLIGMVEAGVARSISTDAVMDVGGGSGVALGVDSEAGTQAVSAVSAEESVEAVTGPIALSDSFSSEFADFAELEKAEKKESTNVIGTIVNFIKSLFGR
jgi:hypothetical protein